MGLIRTLFLGTAILGLVLAAGLFLFAAIAPASARLDAPPAALAVLTGGRGARLKAAGALMNAYPDARLLISGVDAASDADLAALLAMDPQDFTARVEAGRIARDTVGNAREVAAWARDWRLKEVVVVTSDYHMARALLEIRREAPELGLRPYAVSVDGARLADWWRDPSAFRRVAPEGLKYAAAWVRTKIAAKIDANDGAGAT